MEKNKQKVSFKLLGRILIITVIILLAIMSFVGIFVKNKNTMKNLIPDYKLGMDIYGARNVIIKVDDSEGKNDEESLTLENYQKVKKIVEQRLEYMNVQDYLIRANEDNGDICLELVEDNNTDYISQYVVTKGVFTISDDETSEILLSNSDVKKASVERIQNGSNTYSIYLTIEFTDSGAEKLKEISNTYVSTTDSEGKAVTKKVKMTLDDQTIISTYFEEEIPDGKIQLSIGSAKTTSELESYAQQANNIAIFLNTDPMPITYKIDINRFVYSDITEDVINAIIIVLVVIAAIMLIAMVAKFKFNGLLAAVTNIGFLAILLLAVRIGNVVITLSGIFAIAVAYIIEYAILMLMLSAYNANLTREQTNNKIGKLFSKVVISLIPFVILSVSFAVLRWQEIASVGMVMFWAILIMVIYNAIIVYTRFLESEKYGDNK